MTYQVSHTITLPGGTTTAGTTDVSATSNGSVSPSVIGLSPDMILAYCGNMLNNLNSQIETMMGQQQTQIQEQTVIGNLQTTLGQYSPCPTASQMTDINNDFQAALAQLTPGTTAYNDVENAYNSFTGSSTSAATYFHSAPDTPPSQTAWAAATGGLTNALSDVKNNAQIQFLQLQDLCSQQQDAVEQATNMMSKEDQTLLDQAKAAGS
jgi:hypothetical protein